MTSASLLSSVLGHPIPLSPQSFLRRNARVYPQKTAIIDGVRRFSYHDFYARACRQANALAELGLGPEDKVAVLAPNTSMLLEAHFGVHMLGAVLVAINTRLNGAEIAYILKHAEAKALLVDADCLPILEGVWADLAPSLRAVVIDRGGVLPSDETPDAWTPAGALDYEAWLAAASVDDPRRYPADENDVISINYTSGTTGNPKGVMYTHRGAYLNGVCNLLEMQMSPEAVYLWTLPMFHCNGWCYTWSVTAIGGTHVCLRKVEGESVVRAIEDHGVTHFCGAPIVLSMIAEGAQALKLDRLGSAAALPLTCSTAAAPPSPTVIASMLHLGVRVTHVYGLTETYGPITVCERQPDWSGWGPVKLAPLMARQGVPAVLAEDAQVLDAQGSPVPADGETMGEVCLRGNNVMRGYFKNPEATAEAMRGGWFHSGDLGVMHPDGYIELRDRAKDIIISGGENISTIELENALYAHPAIQDVAVVACPDERWGEVPAAFIAFVPGQQADEAELLAFCRERLASYKVPRRFFFQELPRTSTGKVQKFRLRDTLWGDRQKRIQ